MRVYRYEGDRGSRILLTDQLSVRFASYARVEQVRDSLSGYFPALAEDEEPQDGIYQIAGRYSETRWLSRRLWSWIRWSSTVPPSLWQSPPLQEKRPKSTSWRPGRIAQARPRPPQVV